MSQGQAKAARTRKQARAQKAQEDQERARQQWAVMKEQNAKMKELFEDISNQ